MEHVYNCGNNGKETKLKYKEIYEGSLSEQIEIFRTFEKQERVALQERKEAMFLQEIASFRKLVSYGKNQIASII